MEKALCTVRCFAKINLMLAVTGRRGDGYHNLFSLMQSVDVFDDVTLRVTEGERTAVTCGAEAFLADGTNTAFAAAQRFFEYNSMPPVGLEINIEKNIPIGSGMGGGSADAAGVLRALNAIFRTNLSDAQLAQIGRQVGADVPFCVYGSTALAEGIGDILTPLAPLPDCHIVICKPQVSNSTAQMFAAYDGLALKARADLKLPPTDDLRAVCAAVFNDFEAVYSPVTTLIKAAMSRFEPLCCALTGSGSAVFAIFDDSQAAQRCADVLKASGKIFLTRPARCATLFL